MAVELAVDARHDVLGRILLALKKAGTRYALIHGGGETRPSVASDIDIAFEQPPPKSIEPILLELSRRGELDIVQRLHYDVPHGYYYILRVPGSVPLFLHLDCLCDPIGVNRYQLPTTYLLEGAIEGTFGIRTSADRETIYLLMKRAVKGKVSHAGLDLLRERFGAIPQLWGDVDRWFGSSARGQVERLLECRNPAQAKTHLDALARAARRIARGDVILRTRRAILEARRRARRLVKPTGYFVVLVGPDGSGKSSVTAALLADLQRGFRRTWRFHWRPGLLPRLGKASTSSGGPPPETSKYRGVVSLLRFAYYWLDFIIGYWVRIYPARAQSTFIVGERYFPDVLVHPERYGFAVPRWFARAAAAFVPTPDLLVVLADDPRVIYARKPELSPAKIAQQIQAYSSEAKYWQPAVTIKTEAGIEAVARRIEDMVLDRCSTRTLSRMQSQGATARWHAFPSARKVKVWVHSDDALGNALNLYHPYSGAGLMVSALINAVPSWLHRKLLIDAPDPRTERRLTLLNAQIKRILNDESAVVSFYAGTPGPHQKTTAQVTAQGSVIAYVKVGHDAKVSALLEQEARMLRWLEKEQFNAAVVPKVLGFERRADLAFLLISPPPGGSGRQRLGSMDTDDMRFLSAIAAMGQGVKPLEEIFERLKLDNYLASVPAEVAAVLRNGKRAVEAVLGAHGVRVNASHGDFGPWNTLELSDGRMFLIDWEYGQMQAPALNDFFHRVLAPARLVDRRQANSVVAQLLDIAADERSGRLMDQVGVSQSEVPAYLILYLLDQLAMRPNDLPHPVPFLVEAVRLATDWMDRCSDRPRVLVAAYACEPGAGSEPGVGWWMCQAISREHEAWVITRRNNRSRIEQALAEDPNPHLHFVYADLPPWAMTWKKKGRRIRLYYYLWQIVAFLEARKLMKRIHFRFGHHVTFVNDYTFTFLALLNLPFVWGPIGSNDKSPQTLLSGPRSVIRDRLQYYAKIVLRCIDPLMWLSTARARLIIGNNKHVGKRIPFRVLASHKYRTHIAIGVEKQVLIDAERPNDRPFHVLSMGNLIPIKQFHLTVQAFARLMETVPTARLTIVGDGPLKGALEALVRELGVQGSVEFLSWLPRHEAMRLMACADAFLFPSVEAAGMVVLEALANGVPVVGLRGTGPGDMLTPECGIAVPVGSPDVTVERLAKALRTLASDAALRHRMADAGRKLVRDRYLWEERYRTIRGWYRAAGVLRGTAKPALTVRKSWVP